MRIVYFADADCNHGHKWISHFAESHDVALICNESNRLHFYGDEKKIKIFPVLPAIYPLRDVIRKRAVIRKIKNVIREFEPDVLHSFYAVPYSFWAYHADHPRHLITTRGSDVLVNYKSFCNPKTIRQRINSPFLKKLFESTIKNACFVSSTSTVQADVLEKMLSGKSRPSVIRTGVDSSDFLSRFNSLKRTETKLTIFSNRGLAPIYNIDIVIESFRILVEKYFKEVAVTLVQIDYSTDKNYRKVIERKISSSGLSGKVFLLPEQSFMELIQLYRNSDLVIMLPSTDGTPVSAIEAMLSRVPVLMGPAQYDKDLFFESTVWKTPSLNPDSVAHKMAEILSDSKGHNKRITDHAFELALKKADFKNEMSGMENVYKEIFRLKQSGT